MYLTEDDIYTYFNNTSALTIHLYLADDCGDVWHDTFTLAQCLQHVFEDEFMYEGRDYAFLTQAEAQYYADNEGIAAQL